MHIIDLAIILDLAISLLLDWTDTRYINAARRQLRLNELAASYRSWAGNDSDRCNKKLFTEKVLKPGGAGFAMVLQHYVSAAAARGLIIWLSKMANQYAATHGEHQDLFLGLNGKVIFRNNCFHHYVSFF